MRKICSLRVITTSIFSPHPICFMIGFHHAQNGLSNRLFSFMKYIWPFCAEQEQGKREETSPPQDQKMAEMNSPEPSTSNA